MTADHTVGRWLVDRAAADPAKIAIDDRGLTVTYGALAERAGRLAAALRREGFGPGDRIASVAGSSTEQVVAFFACALAGVALAPLSWRLTARELARSLARTEPSLVLVDDAHVTLAREAAVLAGVEAPHAPLGAGGIEAAVPAGAGRGAAREVEDEDALLVIFTSGSSADPKGAVLTHRTCFWTNLSLAQAMPLTSDDVVLAMLPQFHVAAWNVQPLLAWWVGATVVLESAFQPSRVLRLIEERGVTAIMGVPTQYRLLADQPAWRDADLGSLRLAVVGGARMPLDVAESWAAHGVPLTPGYGLTEAGPNVLHLPAHEALEAPESVGRPYPHVEVRLVDPGNGLEVETSGELQVRGPGLFAGYLGEPDATAAAFDGEWLRTGDLASRDRSGRYAIVDRLKDIYISGGENVAPAEVERALELHPLVDAAAAVGVPDRVWGERGVAFVVLRRDAVVSEDELVAHAREHLAGFKVPMRIVIVDALPRLAGGKVARVALKSRARALMQEVDHDRR